jgi:hypothetical protein
MANKIGDFLLKVGSLSQLQIDEVLRAQAAGDTRLFGEIAVAKGFMHEDSLKRFVDYLETRQGTLPE